MSIVFGIDLGTTNSVIAKLKDGRPAVIPISGQSTVPSVVLYQDGRVAVGREARNLELQYPELTIRSVKRRMGQDFTYDIAGRRIAPEDVSAEILRALKRGAESATGETVKDVVITVPAYFNDAQRKATLRAGELAGLNVLRLLNEPTSASLVYDQVGAAQDKDSEIVLVYDLGGGTFDVSVMEIFGGVREVRATTGNTQLGGDDFDELLVRLFHDELKRVEQVETHDDPRAMARLRALAEQTKIRLSSETEVRVREEFIAQRAGQPVHLDLTVTRRGFEEMILPMVRSTIELAQRAVVEAKLGDQRIGRVCLVGGSTRIPLVRAHLEMAFEVPVHEEVDPDLAVALGAAIQSGLVVGEKVERILVDVTAHSLGIRALSPYNLDGDTFAPILRRNTALPATRTEEFYTAMENQKAVNIEAFQGESPRVSQNVRVGAFRVELAPRPAGSPVRVQFAYDLNGVVRVSVAQPGEDNEKTVAFSLADVGKAPDGEVGEVDAAAGGAAAGGAAAGGAQFTVGATGPDSGASGTSAAGQARPGGRSGQSAIERKAETLLGKLTGTRRDHLAGLIATYRAADDAGREAAEEALLDFFLGADDEEG